MASFLYLTESVINLDHITYIGVGDGCIAIRSESFNIDVYESSEGSDYKILYDWLEKNRTHNRWMKEE